MLYAKAGSPPPDSRRRCRPPWPTSTLWSSDSGSSRRRSTEHLTGQFGDEEILELTYIATLYLAHAVAAKALRLEDDNPALG